jgi:hypothetical protein
VAIPTRFFDIFFSSNLALFRKNRPRIKSSGIDSRPLLEVTSLTWCHKALASVVTDPGIGIQRSDSLALFAGEIKSGSLRQGFESLVPGKKHPKLPEISQIWATFGTKMLLTVFCVFLRVYPFGVNRTYCYGSFLWNLGIRILKIRIGFKSFF